MVACDAGFAKNMRVPLRAQRLQPSARHLREQARMPVDEIRSQAQSEAAPARVVRLDP
jgi:hypothetical protein